MLATTGQLFKAGEKRNEMPPTIKEGRLIMITANEPCNSSGRLTMIKTPTQRFSAAQHRRTIVKRSSDSSKRIPQMAQEATEAPSAKLRVASSSRD